MNRLLSNIMYYFIHKYQKWIIIKRGIWFVDIPKTSSSSIRKEMGRKYGIVFDKNKNEFSYPPHYTAIELKRFLNKNNWDNLLTFSIVRNPWDKTLSYFLWAKSKGYLKRFDFRDFVFEIKKQFETGQSKLRRHAYAGCADYLYSKDGELLVDFVVKFENRTEGLEMVREKINERQKYSFFRFSKKEFGAIKINVSEENLFNKHYDHELIEIVGIVYEKDIQLFNYETPFINDD